MPISCDIRLDPVHVDKPLDLPARIVGWLVQPLALVEPGTPIARLSMAGTEFDLLIRFRCQVHALNADPGVDLQPDAPLLRVAAEGEDVPPGFRYCELG